MTKSIFTFLLLGLTLTISSCLAEEPATKDIVFAKPDGIELKLNLYLPAKREVKPPLVVFIHGGGWYAGNYTHCGVVWLRDQGYAVASIGYRLSNQAIFPAQVHDCKAAVRWLRAHADDYGYDTSKLVVAGSSAGGYLALMLGVTGDNELYEGSLGDNLTESTQVAGIINYFGPTDFLLRSKNQPFKTEDPQGSVFRLLGESSAKNPELAKFASPAYQVTKESPPLLSLHGTKDDIVYLQQARRMAEAYDEMKRPNRLLDLEGAGHGGAAFEAPEVRRSIVDFIESATAK